MREAVGRCVAIDDGSSVRVRWLTWPPARLQGAAVCPQFRRAAAGQSAAGLRWTCGSQAGHCEVGLWASHHRLLLEGRINHCPRGEEGAVNKVPFGWAWRPGSPSTVRESLGPSQGNGALPAAPWPRLAELHSAARRVGEAGWACCGLLTHRSHPPSPPWARSVCLLGTAAWCVPVVVSVGRSQCGRGRGAGATVPETHRHPPPCRWPPSPSSALPSAGHGVLLAKPGVLLAKPRVLSGPLPGLQGGAEPRAHGPGWQGQGERHGHHGARPGRA